MRSEVLKGMTMKMIVSLDVVLRSLVNGYQHFAGTLSPNHQVIKCSQKAVNRPYTEPKSLKLIPKDLYCHVYK
jgi:hypothetical protein